MPLWAALWCRCALDAPPRDAGPPGRRQVLQGLGHWALQFTPRVAALEDAVLLELAASRRLFGGREALKVRIEGEGRELGADAVAWAPTGLGALALARAGAQIGPGRTLASVLDSLPFGVLDAAQAHAGVLARLGCRTLGDLRGLPRGGLARRFDAEILGALDRAYGQRPEGYAWLQAPEVFQERLELPSRIETAPALLFGARRLILQLCGWLANRHAGVIALRLGWQHDAMRSREAGEGGELVLRTAEPLRAVEPLSRLLGEHLAHVELQAPVGDIELQALEVQPLAGRTASLLLDAADEEREPLHLVLERISARLGPGRVLRAALRADHRPECMQTWRPAAGGACPSAAGGAVGRDARLPQPSWILPEPLVLAEHAGQPLYQGPLQLLVGPHRVEGAWWHRSGHGATAATGMVQREYWVARSAHAGLLWVFRTAGPAPGAQWFLQGIFG